MLTTLLADVQKAIAHQPAPQPGGVVVYPVVLDMITEADKRCVEHKHLLMDMIKLRVEFGKAHYGQPLSTVDGRDTQADCLQEVLDLLIYMGKAYVETDNSRWYVLFHLVMMVANEMLQTELYKVQIDAITT